MAKKIGIYGPAVIGKEKFEAEQEIVKTKSNLYGPAVLDSHPAAKALKESRSELEEAKAELEEAKDPEARHSAQERLLAARKKAGEARAELAASNEGPASSEITEPKRPLVDEQEPDPPPPGAPDVEATDEVADAVANLDFSELTVKDLEETLSQYANATIPALNAELQRDEPRTTALRAILAAEQARHGGAREEVVKAIEEAL